MRSGQGRIPCSPSACGRGPASARPFYARARAIGRASPTAGFSPGAVAPLFVAGGRPGYNSPELCGSLIQSRVGGDRRVSLGVLAGSPPASPRRRAVAQDRRAADRARDADRHSAAGHLSHGRPAGFAQPRGGGTSLQPNRPARISLFRNASCACGSRAPRHRFPFCPTPDHWIPDIGALTALLLEGAHPGFLVATSPGLSGCIRPGVIPVCIPARLSRR